MTHRFISALKNFFNNLKLRQEEVDYYIASKNPSNSVEVEFWLRQFERKEKTKWI
jgi:hypothetical protein